MEHKCEQGTFCVECGRYNRPMSGWEERFDEVYLHINYADIDDNHRCQAWNTVSDEEDMTASWVGFFGKNSPELKAFIRKEKELSREDGRREHNQECNFDHQEEMNYATERVRQATIALFEEWADDMELTDRKKKLPKKHDIMIAGMEELFKKGYNFALTDLLAYADSLKKKHD